MANKNYTSRRTISSFCILLFATISLVSCGKDEEFVNTPPTINFVEVEDPITAYNSNVEISLNLSDVNSNQSLITSWFSDGGSFITESTSEAVWKAPSVKGSHTIEVEVSDGIETVMQTVGSVIVAGTFVDNFNAPSDNWAIGSNTSALTNEGKVVLATQDPSGNLAFIGRVGEMIDDTSFPIGVDVFLQTDVDFETDERLDINVLFSEPENLLPDERYVFRISIYLYPGRKSDIVVFRYGTLTASGDPLFGNIVGTDSNADGVWNWNRSELNNVGIHINENLDITFYGNHQEIFKAEGFSVDGVRVGNGVDLLTIVSERSISIDHVILDNTDEDLYAFLD